jgi:chitin synthase
MILAHLTSLSSNKKESKLQTQILHVQTILDAFGHAKTTSHQNASQFGKYLEFQFNERGRVIGCKLLNYLLNKKRLVKQPKGESNFNIFYSLLLGVSPKEKQAMNLLDQSNYLYTKSTPSPYSPEEGLENYEALKSSLRHFGIGKKHQTRIVQLLASILNIGQLQFVDDKTVQEAAFVKDEEALISLADSLGVDPLELQNVMTYKTKLVGKDVTTLILDAEQAGQQRDELAAILYSLLFTWIIETINSKICIDDTHNVIGVLDFPGWRTNTGFANLDQFCLNYANERLQSYVLNYIFETHTSDYRQDGLEYPNISYNDIKRTVEMMDQHRHGVIDVVNNLSKKSAKTELFAITDALNKHQPGIDVSKTDTGAHVFSIQHFCGTQTYQPNDFIESNRDALDADFVTLFRGSSDIPPSTNSFLVHLFEDKSIITELHPKDNDHILNAQQNNKPNRQPSMKRSRSLKVNNDTITEKKKSKKVIPTALAQVRSSMNDLFASLDETIAWFIFCIRPSKTHQLEFDSEFVRHQVASMQLSAIASNFKQYPYTNILSIEDFLERYISVMETQPEDLSSKETAQLVLDSLDAQNSMIGNENVSVLK